MSDSVSSRSHSKESVRYGAWNAIKKVPEWHGQKIMTVYDRYFAPRPETDDEQAATMRIRAVVQKQRC